MSSLHRTIKEDIATFLQEPDREKLREVLKNIDGEYNHIDFKTQWIDDAKIAKHILSFANSGGGLIVFGVKEDGDDLIVEGIEDIRDKADLSIDNYLPEIAHDVYFLWDCKFDTAEWGILEGKQFQLIFIEDDPTRIPIVSNSNEGPFRDGAIYHRRNSKSIEANNQGLNNIIRRRIEAELNSASGQLEKDLEELKILYSFQSGMLGIPNLIFSEFDRYIDRITTAKKVKIEENIGIIEKMQSFREEESDSNSGG